MFENGFLTHSKCQPKHQTFKSATAAVDRCVQALITARVAKRAKVMFSQACVTHSVQLWGGVGTKGLLLPPGKVIKPPSPSPGHNTSPPLARSQHLSPARSQHPPPGQVITPPPGHSAQAGDTHPPGMHSCLKYDFSFFKK